MKLRTRIILYIVESILVVVIVLSILFNLLFNTSFNNYLKNVQQERFNKLRDEISYMLEKYGLDAIPNELPRYAGSESIEIEILDSEGKSVINLNTLNEKDSRKIVRKEYKIIEGGIEIGTMVLSYYQDVYYDNMALDFRRKYSISIIGTGIIALISGILASIFLSKMLSASITELSSIATKYRDGNYSVKPLIETDVNELAELKESMVYLGESLKSQEDIRKRYAQDISHELRTPLTNLQVHLEAISDGIIELDEGTVKILTEEIYHLNNMVDKLNTSFSGLNSDEAIVLSWFNISEELIHLNHTIAPSLKVNGVKLKSEIQEGLMINSDRDKIVQIMYNLLSNASKAVKRGGIITVCLKSVDNHVEIKVSDNGIGIAADELEYVFERFYRADSARSNRLKGSGLGLAIVKSLLNQLGGSISAESTLGRGSTFTVILPTESEN